MSVSHRGKRTITVNNKRYLWRVKKRTEQKIRVPMILEIIDPEARVKKTYGPLSKIDAQANHTIESLGETAQRLKKLGALVIHHGSVVVATPGVIARLILEDFA